MGARSSGRRRGVAGSVWRRTVGKKRTCQHVTPVRLVFAPLEKTTNRTNRANEKVGAGANRARRADATETITARLFRVASFAARISKNEPTDSTARGSAPATQSAKSSLVPSVLCNRFRVMSSALAAVLSPLDGGWPSRYSSRSNPIEPSAVLVIRMCFCSRFGTGPVAAGNLVCRLDAHGGNTPSPIKVSGSSTR